MRWLGLLIGMVVLSSHAHAAPSVSASKQACVDAHTEAQRQRRQGAFNATRAQLSICRQATCPGPVADECTRWLDEIEAQQPTVIFTLEGATGRDPTEIKVWLDGALLLPRLDGRPVAIDPGDHLFRYQWPDGSSVEDRVLVTAGEKGRRLAIAIKPAPLPATTPAVVEAQQAVVERSPAPSSVPVVSWILWGVGAVAAGAFAYLAISGRSDESALDTRCRGRCSPDEVAAVRRKYLAADLSLGAALLSGGAATAIAVSF